MRKLSVIIFLMMSVVGAISCTDSGNIDEEINPFAPIEGGNHDGMVMLKLSNHGIEGVTHWDENDALLVNNRSYYVNFNDSGEAVLYVQPESSNNYSVVFPAKLYDRIGRKFTLPFAQHYDSECDGGSFLPATGVANEQGEVELSTECIVAKFTLAGEATLRSVRLENRGEEALSGQFLAKDIQSLNNKEAINNRGVTLNFYERDEALLSMAGTPYYISLPKGNYSQGLILRVSDTNNRYQEYEITPLQSEGGKLVDLGTFLYQPDQNILYANHFDNMTWGGDIVGEKMGLGLGSSTTDTASAEAKGSELALQPKEFATAGTQLYDKLNYNNFKADYIQAKDSETLAVEKDYLENRGLLDWWCLFFGAEYNGYIGGGDSGSTNRGILTLPHLSTLEGSNSMIELSFDFAMLEEAGCNLRLRLLSCVLEKLTIDNEEVDVNPETTQILSLGGSLGNSSHPYVILDKERFGDNKWHKITVRLASVTALSQLNFYPVEVREVNTRYFVDNIVIRKINYKYNDVVYVAPTTELGSESDDISKMHLQVGSTGSAIQESTTDLFGNLYQWSKSYGHTYISPSFGSVDQDNPSAFDDAKWLAVANNSKRVYDAAGVKVWCMHLPYGYQHLKGDDAYFDICSTDETIRTRAVTLLKRIVTAASPIHAKYLLVHCNQHLLYPDTQEELEAQITAMAKSLYELQLHAENKGVSTIVVENMSWGVGSKAGELASAVDQANAMTTNGALKRKVRVAMDTGHATAAMMYANRSGKVTDANIVEWVKTIGVRLGATHIQGNRGANTSASSYSYSVIHDDHMLPTTEGYKASYPNNYNNDGSTSCAASKIYYYDVNARNNLWGEFYKAMLKNCRYRGVFDYECSGLPVATVKDIEGKHFKRSNPQKSMAQYIYNFDYYIYDEFRKLN